MRHRNALVQLAEIARLGAQEAIDQGGGGRNWRGFQRLVAGALVIPFLICLICLIVAVTSVGPAQAACSVPNTIANGQPADASQVMGNFTALGGCATSVSGSPPTGAIATFAGAAAIINGDLSGDVTTSGSTSTTLANSGVNPGAYTCANVTFDAKGRAVSAASGACGGSGSAPTLVQQAAVRGTSGSQTSFPVTLASAPTPGDLLLSIMAGWSGGASLICPSGFSAAYSAQGLISGQGILACARIAQVGDGTTYTGTVSGPNGGNAFGVFEFNGAIGFQAIASSGTPSGTTWPLFASPINGSCYTIGVVESDQSNGYTSITGATLLFDGTGGSQNHPSVMFHVPSLGAVTITYSGSSYGNSVVAVLNVVG